MRVIMRVNRWPGRVLATVSLLSILSLSFPLRALGGQGEKSQDGAATAQAGQQQPPQPQQPQPSAGQQATPDAQTGQPHGLQTFTGMIVKSGDKYVLQDSATGTTYDIDHQDEVGKHVGRKVQVTGTLDPSGKMIHLQPSQP